MRQSVHELVSVGSVARRAHVDVPFTSLVLANQRRIVSAIVSTDAVVLLPGVVVYHPGDPLGRWCDEHFQELMELSLTDDWLPGSAGASEAPEDEPFLGTLLCEAAGCADDLLGAREVVLLDGDLSPMIAEMSGVEESAFDKLNRVLAAFWDTALEVPEKWVWPFDKVAMEREIEDWLEQNLDRLEPWGLHVRLAQLPGRATGRQWRTLDGRSRLDLLLEVVEPGETYASRGDGGELHYQFKPGDLVIVEIKANYLRAADVAQLDRYVETVGHELQDHLGDDQTVWGLLIGAGADAEFYEALSAAQEDIIGHLFLGDIGFVHAVLGLEAADETPTV